MPLRRELELLAQRGRLRLQEPVAVATTPEASSPAASLGLSQGEAEVLALVAAGRTNKQIGQELFITPRPPAFTSPGSWPSSAWRVAGRRPRWRTGSGSTSNDDALKPHLRRSCRGTPDPPGGQRAGRKHRIGLCQVDA
jgi:hypothetical protein